MNICISGGMDMKSHLHGKDTRVHVIPAEAGIQFGGMSMDSRLHGNDTKVNVIPAEAGIQFGEWVWIPVFTGMTRGVMS